MQNAMKTSLFQRAAAAFLLLSLSIAGAGCADDPVDSVYDPSAPVAAAPVVDSITVQGGGGLLSGVSVLNIDGRNFSTDTTVIIVYFDAVRAQLVSATKTRIIAKTPVLVKDSVKVRISIQGAVNFSVSRYVNIKAAVATFGGFTSFEEAYGITCDQAGNIYAAMLSSGLGIGLRKITSAGDTSTYSPKGLGIDVWSALKMGPGGVIYACRNQRAMYTISAAGAPPVLFVAGASSAKYYDLDFDKNKNIWTGGTDTAVYRIKPDKTTKAFAFKQNAAVRSVRVYKDYLYLGGKVDSVEGVWRAPIDVNGDLSAPFEQYFNLSAQPGYTYNGVGVFAITFNTDGEMYVGTDGADGVLLVSAGGSGASKYYPGLFVAGAQNLVFAWGDGGNLYVTRRANGVSTNALLKINTQKSSAPYYGRGDL